MNIPRRKKRRLVVALLVLAGVVAVLGLVAWNKFFREERVVFNDINEHFKYGSIGAEGPAGVPYWIWVVLPRMFPEKLPGPGGYAALGAVWEEGRELPIGFSKMRVGFDRVAINCAACHTTTVRATPGDRPMLFSGGPSTRFQPQGYLRFLFASAADPRFNPDAVMKEIDRVVELSWLDRALYRYVIIPQAKRTLMKQAEEDYAWMKTRPDWGPGRTDMNPFQRVVMKLPDDGTIGSTDMMAVWNERAHEGMLRHSDGMNTTLIEPVIAAALAGGATRKSVDIEGLRRVNDFLLDLPAARYPFPVDPALAARGGEIFKARCAECHAFGGARTGKIIPVEELGTDPNRVRHWPQTSADAFNKYADGYDWKFSQFRSSNGYLSIALDGVWARAPYLHNGSVPTLRDLLEPPESRPKVFFRAYDVYDQAKGGFVSDGPEAAREGFRLDTAVVGNGNGGHLWGTELSPEEKSALVEYMKTL